MSVQLGSEEAEHLRQIFFEIKNLNDGNKGKEKFIKASDSMSIGWLTDCRSLYDQLFQPGMSEVTDKRLAIDLHFARTYGESWERKLEIHALMTLHLVKETQRLHG